MRSPLRRLWPIPGRLQGDDGTVTTERAQYRTIPDMTLIGGISGGVPPPHPRWMIFVDGENLTIRSQQWASENGVPLVSGPYWTKDAYLWLPASDPRVMDLPMVWGVRAVRAHYYTSAVGAEDVLAQYRDRLAEMGFDPRVFKRDAGTKRSKGVDITLATEMLANAFMGNYSLAVLIAGDGDYVPLVEQVKRLGKVVVVGYLDNCGVSKDLIRAADYTQDLAPALDRSWREYAAKVQSGEPDPLAE